MMFDIPDAKRVRREDLHDSSSDDEEDRSHVAGLLARLDKQFASSLEIPDFTAPNEQQRPDAASAGRDDELEEETFEFRLFKSDNSLTKVVLKNERAIRPGEGGFVVPSRPLSFYIASPPSAEQRAQFATAALSGDDIIAMSKRRWWGAELPWRVIHIRASGRGAKQEAAADGDVANADAKRKRPGKKKRLVMRMRSRAAAANEEAAREKLAAKQAELAAKEVRLQQKKKRLNRERKIKRRAKEREKKLAAKTGETVDAGNDHDSGDDSST